MEKNTSPSKEGGLLSKGMAMQLLTAFSVSMTSFCMASSMAFGGVFMEQMTSSETADLTLSTNQISLIVSFFSIGTMLGYLVSSPVNAKLGTIRLLQLFGVPLIAGGYMMIAFGASFGLILVGRILTGFGVGVCIGPTVTHIGEISSVHVRSQFAAMLPMMACSGITCTYLCGWFLPWRHTCLVIGITPMALQLLTSFMLPRSAKWLISKGHSHEEARRSLRIYHGDDYDTTKQIEAINESLGDSHKHDASVFQVLALLGHRHNLLPFLIVLALYSFFCISGGLTTTAFAPVIFKEVGGFHNPYVGSVLLGCVRFATTVVMIAIMNKLERKTFLMVNGVVGGAACAVTGCYFYFADHLVGYNWVPLVSVLTVISMFSFGISPVKTVLLSELVPNAIRAEIGGVVFLFFGAWNFIVFYTFPLIINAWGMAGMYWFFTGMHLLMFVFSSLCVPQTRGKTIEEIQKMFMKRCETNDPPDAEKSETANGAPGPTKRSAV